MTDTPTPKDNNLRDAAIREASGHPTGFDIKILHADLHAWRAVLVETKLKIDHELHTKKISFERILNATGEDLAAYNKFRSSALHVKKRVDLALPRVNLILKERHVAAEAERQLQSIGTRDNKQRRIGQLLEQAKNMMPRNETTERWHLEVEKIFDRVF